MQGIQSQTIGASWPRPARPALAIALALGMALGAVVFLLCRARGYFSDEGSFCTIAQGILQGRLPYQSLFNEKPPLQYFWTAAVMAVSHPTLSGARLASSVALILTAALILRGPAVRGRGWLSLLGWTGLIFLIAMAMAAYNDTAETSLAVLFCFSALLLASDGWAKERPRLIAALQGAIFGIALGFRQTALLPALIMLALPGLDRWAYIGGFAAGLAAWLAPLVALGIGPDLLHATVLFHANNSLAETYFRGPDLAGRIGFLVWFLCLCWLAGLKEYGARRVWLILWVASLALSFSGRMDAFRLWPSTAAMLVLIARAQPRETVLARLTAASIAAIAFMALLRGYPPRNPNIAEISQAIMAKTGAGERIWVGPFRPLSYCLAQRQPVSRYYFILPWTDKEDVRREIVSDIAASPPNLIVIDDTKGFLLSNLLPEMTPILAKDYHSDGVYGRAVFYARNRPARALAAP